MWLGVFFVAKKSGKLRIILDTRDLNGVFAPPPYTGLPTADALRAIETNPDGTVWFAGSDISDCFYRFGVSGGLDEYLSLPGILGSEVESIARRHRLPLRAKLVPCLKVLPMGWSWSFFFAQKVNEARIVNCGLFPCRFTSDKQPGSKLDSDESKIALYVDNNLVMGRDREAVIAGANKIAADLDGAAQDTHEAFEGSECDFVGLRFDRRHQRVRMKWERVWRICMAVQYVLDRGVAGGHDTQVLVGISRGPCFSIVRLLPFCRRCMLLHAWEPSLFVFGIVSGASCARLPTCCPCSFLQYGHRLVRESYVHRLV